MAYWPYNSEMPKARCPRNQLRQSWAAQLLLLGIVRSRPQDWSRRGQQATVAKNKQTLHKCGSANRGNLRRSHA